MADLHPWQQDLLYHFLNKGRVVIYRPRCSGLGRLKEMYLAELERRAKERGKMQSDEPIMEASGQYVFPFAAPAPVPTAIRSHDIIRPKREDCIRCDHNGCFCDCNE